jgi:hypothetical protein
LREYDEYAPLSEIRISETSGLGKENNNNYYGICLENNN